MGESRPPFRAAFWAISAALVLLLLLTLSDPYQVRLSILASHHPTRPGNNSSHTPVLASHRSVPENAHAATPLTKPLPMSADLWDSSPDATTDDLSTPVPPPLEPPDLTPEQSTLARTHIVSSSSEGNRIDSRMSEATVRPAMPILSPGSLSGPRRRGEFVELPPPPGMPPPVAETAATLSSDTAPSTSPIEQQPSLTPTMQQLTLEADLLSLRRDLSQLVESQHAEQLQSLQQEQSLLLDRQQESAARLERLADQIDLQTAQLENLLARYEQSTAAAAPASAESIPDSSGMPHFDRSDDGRERFSLIIESDDVADVLERLGSWSRKSTDSAPLTPLSQSVEVETQPRYLAPPAQPHRSATPVVPTPPSQQAHNPAGPTFAAPCNCR